MQKRNTEAVTLDEIASLVSAAGKTNEKVYTILLLVVFAACRPEELATLRPDEVEFSAQRVRSLKIGRGDERRKIVLDEMSGTRLYPYLHKCTAAQVFPGLSAEGIRREVEDLSRSILNRAVTPEALRQYMMQNATVARLHPN